VKKLPLRLILLGLAIGLSGTAAAQRAAAGLESALQATLTHHPALRSKRAEVKSKAYLSDSARAQR
jgi:hypothetical protein